MQFGHSNQLNSPEHFALDKWAKAATVSQAEMMRLSSRRAKAYLELPKSMVSCRTPHDIVAQQQAFWQQCAQDYAAAAQVMASSWTQFFPFGDSITGLDDTINDESLQSAPQNAGERDVMSVQGAAQQKSASGRRKQTSERAPHAEIDQAGRIAEIEAA